MIDMKRAQLTSWIRPWEVLEPAMINEGGFALYPNIICNRRLHKKGLLGKYKAFWACKGSRRYASVVNTGVLMGNVVWGDSNAELLSKIDAFDWPELTQIELNGGF